MDRRKLCSTVRLFIAVLMAAAPALAGERFIAYEVPEGTVGNQDILGTTSIGMDFDVNLAISITRLGVFDSGSDGLFLTLKASIYDRDTTLPVASLSFTPVDPGELIGGSRFKDLDPPLDLSPGFRGSIVCYGQGQAEMNYNTFGGSSAGLWSTNQGHCAISFVGASRYGSGDVYPPTVDTGPEARYAAGTFEFEQLEEPVPVPAIAYVVPELTYGNFPFSGPLGMDFDVRTDIEVDRLGVFDSNSDGLYLPITALLYDRDTRSELARMEFTELDPGDLVGGSRFKIVDPPIPLPAGARCSIVAEGYGDLEPAGSLGWLGEPVGMSTDQGGCSIYFVGSSRYGFLPGAYYPDMPDWGPAVRYAAGTFSFYPALAAIQRPSPPTGLSVSQAAGGIKITWIAPAGPSVAGYNVYATIPGREKLNGDIVTQTQFTTESVVKGIETCFVVRSVSAAGIESGDSSEACAAFSVSELSPTFIAYRTPAGAVGQSTNLYAGSLGQDFDTKTPIVVTRLGVFDDASDGLKATITAHLYDRDTQAEIAILEFTPSDQGELVGGHRLKALSAPIRLPAGFRGTIAAEGYTAAERYGDETISTTGSFTDTGGCSLVFLNPRYGLAGRFPTNLINVPPLDSIYVGGTFEFAPAEPPPAEPDSGIAYVVPSGTLGNQDYPGSLGVDFDVKKAIRVTRLGVFDAGSDGLAQIITAILYNRTTQEALATLDFTADEGELIGGSRFKDLPGPIDLSVGFRGTMVAQGYGLYEMNGNKHGNQDVKPWTTFSGNCRIAFLGGCRNSGLTPAFPVNLDFGPPDRYAGGTFVFGPAPDVDFTVSPGLDVTEGDPVSFDASATSSLNGAITAYSWDFGDAGTGSGATTSHAYQEPGRFKVTLTATDSSGATASLSKTITVLFRSGDVSPWISTDIGDPPPEVKGGARREGGCLKVYAGGKDILLRADQFHFVYQRFAGDGTIVAHIPEVTWEAGAKVGLMLREDLTPSSRFLAILLTNATPPATNPRYVTIRRTTVGGLANSVNGADVTFPDAWVKIERDADKLTTWHSTDGSTWIEPKEYTLDFPSGCYGGIAASSKEVAGEYTDLLARVCDIQVTGIDEPPGAPTDLAAEAAEMGKITLTWSAPASGPVPTGYAIYRNDSKLTDVPASPTAYTDSGLSDNTEYCYKVKSTLGALESDFSNEDCATTVGAGGGFKRGDANADGAVDLSDPVNVLGFLFLGNPATLNCKDAADSDDSGELDITDAVYSLNWQFLGGKDIPAPGPFTCGEDLTADPFPACGYPQDKCQ